ncbi:MAG: flagellar hook capping protein [Caloramator sp.]|jgi:flagellar basal-body rod modification protein FlgD|nr:flagellar hook capping protein [Caloramator sp.]
MEVNKILNNFYNSRNTNNSVLDKNAFLKILTVQLSNQDPLNAKDNTEYIAQMAQFSSLEQIQNLNNTLEKFFLSQKFSQATNLIGKSVEVLENNSIININVESVRLIGNEVFLVSKDYKYKLDNIVSVKLKENSNNEIESESKL